ncbi:hypothetical protein SMSP2_00278 [Limihaloglobus sulfuriphilus]|uniref:Ice-binding protein C-terminal domain-containing protein n=1 Tax=Limihaloglobus sulfuriphilus TaxID=1851148 RepID=A0A1Q2MB93_9BACT|nr:PEP-CTERM sorting domain-containing protein [Limihaloglobus sulfuriphilus]AQQ69944.1 hypothetical protein SMSP2_00278 [Limihaloglobus sulfuriphilus]
MRKKVSSGAVCIAAAFLAFQCLTVSAAEITLGETNAGYYWWQRTTGFSTYTDDGFNYGDANGYIISRNDYQYYGGSDRYFYRADAFFQIDISSVSGQEIQSAALNFYLISYSSDSPTNLMHLTTQTAAPTGDAAQQIAGDTAVAASDTFVSGWNSIDVTDQIKSDITNGYGYAVFSIPKFAQTQDINRVMVIAGPKTDYDDGSGPTKPYLSVTVPEPASMLILAAGGLLAAKIRKRQ